MNEATSQSFPSFLSVWFIPGGVYEYRVTLNWTPYVGQVRKKRETNEIRNPGEVQVHMWEVEVAEIEEEEFNNISDIAREVYLSNVNFKSLDKWKSTPTHS